MNRLVILGNGFDLAHGLPTRYKDFMLHYLKDVFTNKYDESGLISLTEGHRRRNTWGGKINSFNSVTELITFVKSTPSIATFKFESRLLKNLSNSFFENNWVDIESEYYQLLKMSLKDPKYFDIKELNKDFETLKNLLEKYLLKEVEQKYEFMPSEEFLDIFITKNRDFKEGFFTKATIYPEKTFFLNFNYTTLIEEYLIEREIIHNLGSPEVNYIHGELKNFENPIIFGFGDEIDKNYKEIEELNNNAYFEHIKSFQYLKTSNYQNLIRFLDGSTEGYEIYIIGHSCGLSDRTLLNHVFEHDNCKKIKIFYHKDLKGYTNTVYEISRHFNDKSKMRTKIVPFDQSSKTPQVQLRKKQN